MFTDKQMIEISRARDRLLDYKDKIQPYPLEELKEDTEPKIVYQVEHKIIRAINPEHERETARQASKIAQLETQLNEHLDKNKKPIKTWQ